MSVCTLLHSELICFGNPVDSGTKGQNAHTPRGGCYPPLPYLLPLYFCFRLENFNFWAKGDNGIEAWLGGSKPRLGNGLDFCRSH